MANFSIFSERLRTNLWVAYLGLIATWMVLSYQQLFVDFNQGKLFALVKDGRPYVADFVNHYNAALLARQCLSHPVSIYDPAVQAASEAKIIAPVKVEIPFYLQMPPSLFLLACPLAWFSIFQAWLIWTGVSLLLLLVVLRLMICSSLPGTFSRVFALVAALACFPEWQGFREGNASLWLTPGILGFWYFLRSRPVVASLAASACLVKVQYLPVAGLSGLFVGRLPFFIGLLAIASLQVLASIALLGWQNVAAFPSAMLNGERSSQLSGVAAASMQNLRGELILLTGSDHGLVQIAYLSAMALALLAVVFLWRGYSSKSAADPNNDRQFKIRASITTLLMLTTSVHTHAHDYALAILPCLWLWETIVIPSDLPGRLRGAAKVAIVSIPALSWVFYLFGDHFHQVFIQPFFLWASWLSVLACLALAQIACGLPESTLSTDSALDN